jgi:transposase
MLTAITLREDFDGLALRGLAKKSRDANQMRHLLPLAEIYDGGSRGDAARIGGVGLQTIRDWVLRLNARGPAGLIDGKAPGRAPKLNDAQREALARIIESGPIPADRPGAMDLGGVPHQGGQADLELAATGDGVPQTFGQATPSRSQRVCRRGA